MQILNYKLGLFKDTMYSAIYKVEFYYLLS